MKKSSLVSAMAFAMTTVIALADSHVSDVPDELLACAAEQSDAARLRCFDLETEKILPAPEPEITEPVDETDMVSAASEVDSPADTADVDDAPAPPSDVSSAAGTAAATAAVAGTSAAPDAETSTAPDEATSASPDADTPEKDEVSEFGMTPELAEQDPDYEEGILEIKSKVVEVSKRPGGEHIVTLDNGQVWTEKDAEYGFRIKVGDTAVIKKGKLGGYRLVGRGNRSSSVTRVK